MLQRFKSIWKAALIIAVIFGGLGFLSTFEITSALIYAGSAFLGVILLIFIVDSVSPTKYTLDQRIDKDFPLETREKARSILNRVTLANREIVQKRILELARGDAGIVEHLVERVENGTDYREVLSVLNFEMLELNANTNMKQPEDNRDR
jgi:hypothetical protein